MKDRLVANLRLHAPTLAGAVLLLTMYLAAGARYDHFLTGPVFFNLLDDRAVRGLLALGMTFVILSGGIDLSVGAVMGLASMIIAALIREGWATWAAIPAGILTATVFGAIQGITIQITGLSAFIVTLAGMFLARGLGFFITTDSSIAISDPLHAQLASFHWSSPSGSLRIGAMIMLVAFLIASYAAKYTRFGRATYAVGGSEEAASLMGLRIAPQRIAIYTLSGFCSGLAGAVLSLQLSSGSNMEGVGMELDAIAAVVIGGTLLSGGAGSILGTLVGTLIIGLVVTIVTTYEGGFTSGATSALIGALLLAFVLLQKGLSLLARAGSAPARPL